jgi:GNAT superfamily N-acetyltransferase
MDREQVLERGGSVPGVTVRPLREADIADYVALLPVSAELIDIRLRNRHFCVAAWRGGRIVGARWSTTVSADLRDIGASFPLRPGVTYTYDAFTAPEARGCGIAGMVTAALFERAYSSGSTSVINAVLPENPFGQGLARRRSTLLGTLRSNRVADWLIVRCRIPEGYLGPPVPFTHPMSPQAPDGR